MVAGFFPNGLFGWIFVIALTIPLIASSIIDWRTYRIPKQISVGLFALGWVFTLIRAAWLGSKEMPVWLLDAGGIGIGLADGFLFGLLGFLTGFGIFFLFWILGSAGGGDVKLAGAIGVWLGPNGFLVALVLSAGVVFFMLMIRIINQVISGKPMQRSEISTSTGKRRIGGPRLSYSLPLTIGTIGAILGMTATDLGLIEAAPKPAAVAPSE